LLFALRQSRHKIFVFFAGVLILVSVMGSIMYFLEGPENGFKSIPLSVYWAIVTLTTVGYGDIVPHTVVGRIIASCIMLVGYSIIAIPTGIVGAEVYKASSKRNESLVDLECSNCGETLHFEGARYCHQCGEALPED